MSQCDCCGQEVQLLEVIGNADQEPWQVCARCLRELCRSFVPAAERLAQALAAAGIPFDVDAGAGLLALGAALLRAHGLSLTEVQLLASEFYAIAPALARAAMEGES